MDTPCKLTFIHSPNETYQKSHSVSVFVNDKDDVSKIPEEDIVVLTENIDLSIVFIATPTGKFYMDGLDTLPETLVQEDERGDVFLSSSEKKQVLYTNKSEDGNSYYPLIPGYYRIKIEVGNEQYYTLIRIRPKQISEEQWETMRKEIEETLHGLAQDLVRKNSNISSEGGAPIPLSYMRQWLLLRKGKAQLLNSIEEIQKAPRYQIVKKYEIVPNALAKRFNEETIKFRSQHPEKKDMIKEAKQIIGYNLPENRWLLHIVDTLAAITKTLGKFLVSYEKAVVKEMEELKRWGNSAVGRIRIKQKVLVQIGEMRRDVQQFRSAWHRCLESSWIKEVNPTLPQEMPMALLMDSRYRLLYQMYTEIKNEDFSISLNPAYTYHWKRTDYLYEIWGFIQVVSTLMSEDLGFTPTKGWLYDTNDILQGIMVPELRPGTFVEFTKDTLRVRVLYEEELASSAEDTSLDRPLYTSSPHNLPDCRIDVFDERGHIGSLLLDFKYRRLQSIWDRSKIKTRRQTKTMKQLDAYTTACRSPWHLKGRNSERIINRFRPVAEVWPVFPSKYDVERKREVDEYHIRPMDVTPGKDNTHFRKQLQLTIEDLRMTAEDITTR